MKKKRILKFVNSYKKKIKSLYKRVHRHMTMLVTYLQNITLRFLSLFPKFFFHHKRIITKALIPFIIIGGGFYACTAAQRAVLTDVSQIFSLSDEIRTYYVDKPDYWGLDTASLIKNHIIPRRHVHKKKIILSSGKQILVGNGINAEPVMPMAQTFDIVLPNLNKAQCISYAEAPLNNENSLKLYSLEIVNSAGSYLFEWGGKRSLPISKYSTKDLCLDRNNTLIWSIK